MPRTLDDIAGEVAIVTGASRGLGLELAHEPARNRARLVICARPRAGSSSTGSRPWAVRRPAA